MGCHTSLYVSSHSGGKGKERRTSLASLIRFNSVVHHPWWSHGHLLDNVVCSLCKAVANHEHADFVLSGIGLAWPTSGKEAHVYDGVL